MQNFAFFVPRPWLGTSVRFSEVCCTLAHIRANPLQSFGNRGTVPAPHEARSIYTMLSIALLMFTCRHCLQAMITNLVGLDCTCMEDMPTSCNMDSLATCSHNKSVRQVLCPGICRQYILRCWDRFSHGSSHSFCPDPAEQANCSMLHHQRQQSHDHGCTKECIHVSRAVATKVYKSMLEKHLNYIELDNDLGLSGRKTEYMECKLHQITSNKQAARAC